VKQVVFGHTHEKMRSFTKGITVVNDGAWQHVEPSFIEILSDGTSQIFEYPLHKLIRPPKKDEDSEQ